MCMLEKFWFAVHILYAGITLETFWPLAIEFYKHCDKYLYYHLDKNFLLFSYSMKVLKLFDPMHLNYKIVKNQLFYVSHTYDFVTQNMSL